MRAIDLYAGVGGWSLGLKLAGIEVVASYEWWDRAIDTHNHNHGGDASTVNIRTLDLETLPGGIEFVVGSPPCTEFSYSNRGGNGDLAEGLKDLVRFFEVVEKVRPKYWVMENVPRVAEVLRQGFAKSGHPLHRFAHLNPSIHVFDMSDFGVPQARKRCIAGNIPFDLLISYSQKVRAGTLGQVVRALAEPEVVDPVWGVRLPHADVTEMDEEPPLRGEELRMNRESKLFHPVYNNMSFPDDPDSPARTVTATCTRVSRESIVISDPKNPGAYRRLTVRERACLQGFPITYQFYGGSFAEKAKMVGNAIPPPFTYLAAQAALGTPKDALVAFEDAGSALRMPEELPDRTEPDREGRTYPATRRFRAAIPHLRFKSGMRFDLSNEFSGGIVEWKVRFYFGPSKNIREVYLDSDLSDELEQSDLAASALVLCAPAFESARHSLQNISPGALQQVWTRRADGMGPFEVTDLLGSLADNVFAALSQLDRAPGSVEAFVCGVASEGVAADELPNLGKLKRNALRVLAGFIVGSWFNSLFDRQVERAAA